MRSVSRQAAGAGCAVLVSLLCAAAVRAHELGTTRVAVTFHEGRTYEVEIVTDAAALVDKLEASAGESTPADAGPERLQSLLTRFDDVFRRRVKLAFEATEVHPAVAYRVTPGTDAASAPMATIRMTGPIPPGGRQFTWTYAWTFASYAMTVRNAPTENAPTAWLEGGQRSAPFLVAAPAPRVDRLRTAWRYLELGFVYILPRGLDQMLFVLGLYLLGGGVRSMLWQVGAFTAAHSITLGLSLYGVADVPASILAPLIALSIAYVAIENVFLADARSWRVALVFVFGLLHGLGAVGAIRDAGLPRGDLVTALLTFNIGVEAAQLAVIGAAFVLVGWYSARCAWYRSRVVVPASTLIAFTAVYWTIERLPF